MSFDSAWTAETAEKPSTEEVVIPLLSEVSPQAAQRVIVIGIPQLGEGADQHLFATFRLDGSSVTNRKDLGGWNQQKGMQPSHIRKQQRNLEINDVAWAEDGGLSFAMRASLATPAQLGQSAVSEVFNLQVSLKPGDRAQLPNLRSTRAILRRRKDRPCRARY